MQDHTHPLLIMHAISLLTVLRLTGKWEDIEIARFDFMEMGA